MEDKLETGTYNQIMKRLMCNYGKSLKERIKEYQLILLPSYGDKVPRTGFGRIIGIVWMIMGLILFPVLTAEVSSILTDNSYSLVSKKVRSH